MFLFKVLQAIAMSYRKKQNCLYCFDPKGWPQSSYKKNALNYLKASMTKTQKNAKLTWILFLIQAHLSIGIHYQQTLIINVYKNKAQLAPS